MQDWKTNKLKFNAILCISLVAGLCIIARAFTFSVTTLSPKDLIRDASDCLKLALQDKDEIFSLLHSSEGLAYLKIARRLASDSTLEKSTGIVASELERVLLEKMKKKSLNL